MIGYRDFVPAAVKGRWYEGATFETFDAAVEAANRWIAAEEVKVGQIETVVLPNIHNPSEQGTADASVATASGWASWHQFLRVWYST